MNAALANPLDIANQALLAPSGLDEGRLTRVLGTLLGHAIDNADLYFQLAREESWSLEDGIVKDGSHSIEQGVGVRAIAGEKTGFAYSDEIVMPALEEASRAARAIARQGSTHSVQAWSARSGHRLYLPIDPLVTMNDVDKVSLLSRIAAETRSQLIVATHAETFIDAVDPDELCLCYQQPRLLRDAAERDRLTASLRALSNTDLMNLTARWR